MAKNRLRDVRSEPHEYELPGAKLSKVHEALRCAGFKPIGRGETVEPDAD